MRLRLFYFCLVLLVPVVLAQDERVDAADPQDEVGTESQPISGGVAYEPNKDETEETIRDPFKSPFDLAKERERQRQRDRLARKGFESRNEFMIQELNLKGIFLEARTGYWAIFEVGGDYKWFQTGEKFQDGDLVNITDNEVLFKQYIDDESQELAHREIVLELHRGEE